MAISSWSGACDLSGPSITLRQAFEDAAQRLATDPLLAGSARRDAEILLLHTLGLPRTALLSDPARLVTEEQIRNYNSSIARRLLHEPVQYIVGEQEFYGLPFRVTPAVLIPRPETEHLVEAVLERLPHDRPVNIVDVGTGSGAIAIALARHLPLASILAVDLSPSALEVAKANAHTLEAADRIQFVLSDLLSAVAPGRQHEFFDAVVSNPPYVPTTEAAELHPQVSRYEPCTALFAEGDGLAVYRRLVPQAFAALKQGGLLAMEIGHGQRDAISGLLSGWREVGFIDDLQGIPRVALARK